MPLNLVRSIWHTLFGSLFLLACWPARGQDTLIRLINPSFEGEAPAMRTPQGWFSAGFDGESPPDLQPGGFGCKQKPVDGDTYLGLVTRDNGTWERVGQRLPAPLLRDSLYKFSVCLSVSPEYISQSRISGKTVNYNAPALMRIWGIDAESKNTELLAETPVVTHAQWVRYVFSLLPSRSNLDVLLLEAYYTDESRATNGHLLLDNCSPLELMPGSALADSLRRLRAANQAFIKPETGLYNPSFEWGPNNILPTGWINTAPGFPTAVRSHPAVMRDLFYLEFIGTVPLTRDYPPPTNVKPHDGRRYLSLLASDEGKSQQVSQQMETPLLRDSLYRFSVHLMRSKHFRDYKSAESKRLDFKNPLRLRVWGGTLQKPKMELLAESAAVVQTAWKRYHFDLLPQKAHYPCLTLEAWFVSDFGKPYNGNLLVDGCYLGKAEQFK